jgi:hypothetical protein
LATANSSAAILVVDGMAGFSAGILMVNGFRCGSSQPLRQNIRRGCCARRPAVRHTAEEVNAFAALGMGEIAYVKTFDAADVMALCGCEIPTHAIAFALVDADGSPHLLRGSVAAVLIEAQERGLIVAAIH